MPAASLELLVGLAARTVPGCTGATLRSADGTVLANAGAGALDGAPGAGAATPGAVVELPVLDGDGPGAVLEVHGPAPGGLGGAVATALDDVVTLLAALLVSAQPPAGAADRGGLVRRVGHDMKTPLTSVIGFNQFLAASARGPAASQLTQRVAERAQQVLVAVDTLVGFVVPLGRPSFGEVDLPGIVAEVVDDLVTAGEPPPLPQVDDVRLPADRMLLRLLLRSLLHNAAAYASRDEPVAVRARHLDGGWELRVVDRGPGIPEQSRAAVLQPFVRLDRDQGLPGLGVGLTVAARVAAAHGGRLRLEETAGGGTTVVVLVRPPRGSDVG